MSEITPALTAEEWKAALFREGKVPVPDRLPRYTVVHLDKEGRLIMPDAWDEFPLESADRHGVAALCLYGQPFGFTREDATKCRMAAYSGEFNGDPYFDSLADRIEALLPPEPHDARP